MSSFSFVPNEKYLCRGCGRHLPLDEKCTICKSQATVEPELAPNEMPVSHGTRTKDRENDPHGTFPSYTVSRHTFEPQHRPPSAALCRYCGHVVKTTRYGKLMIHNRFNGSNATASESEVCFGGGKLPGTTGKPPKRSVQKAAIELEKALGHIPSRRDDVTLSYDDDIDDCEPPVKKTVEARPNKDGIISIW